MAQKVLRVRVTLKGRPVRALTFNKDSVTIGRDPGSDICLDNPGVSREHARVELTSSGVYMIKDLNSANGVFVNDQPVKTHYIINNDVVFVGKFALWFMYEDDRRGEMNDARRLARTADEGTTVLRTTELQEMIETIRDAEPKRSPFGAGAMATATVGATADSSPKAASSADPHRMRNLFVLGILLAFSIGYVAGGGLRWVPWHRMPETLAGVFSGTKS